MMAGTENQTNHLEMSDEDFLKAPAPQLPAADAVVEDDGKAPVVEKPAGAAEEHDKTDDEDDLDEEEGETKPEGGEDDGGAAKPAAEKPAGGGDKAKEAAKPAEKVLDKDGKEVLPVEKPAEAAAPVAIDYEAGYKRLLAPFKANGREVKVDTVEDAISLMQMGANYNKKMAGLKPSLRILKLLENNGLLDEGKLNFLIDVDKKDVNAINKLVKESGINPMDLDAAKAGDYKATTRTVDDREITLDTVLDDIESSPSYNRTLTIVSKEWDGPSKQFVSANPGLLKLINDHVERGVYDLINAEVERKRMLGRLDGVSDFDAYRTTGDEMNTQGKFNHLGSAQGKPAEEKVVVVPKPKAEDEALKKKRLAAGGAGPAAAAATVKDYNPLGMPDEEFAKQAAPKFK